MSDNRYGCTTEKRLLSCRATPLPRSVLRVTSKNDLKIGTRKRGKEMRRKRDTENSVVCIEILFS